MTQQEMSAFMRWQMDKVAAFRVRLTLGGCFDADVIRMAEEAFVRRHGNEWREAWLAGEAHARFAVVAEVA